MNRLLLGIASLFLVLSLSCNKKDSKPDEVTSNPPPPQGTENIVTRGKSGIIVTDELGQVIPGVRILIGQHATVDNPWIPANEFGQIEIPKTWTTKDDLTVEAPGYVRVTLAQQPPTDFSLSLKKKSQLPLLAMKGTVGGITTKDKDGFVDFAIAVDSLTKNDLLNFNINKVISPWSENITVAGFNLPTPQNIFLPKQKETYFLTLTLQKPSFTLNYDTYGTKSLYTLRGKFPLKKVLGELQSKKPYFELINNFDFSSAGRLEHDFTATSPSPLIDSNQILLDKNYTMQIPVVDSKQVMLGISSFKEKNFYQPLDVKYMQSNETVILKTNQTTAPIFIGVLKNKDEFNGDTAGHERMSVSIAAPTTGLDFLPLTTDPSWISSTELQIDLPSMVSAGLSEQGMVVVVSELQNLTLPDGTLLKFKLPIWEIHSAKWNSTIQIPDLDVGSKISRRVEVTLLARVLDNSGQQNPVTLISNHEERVETATHLTKSARDY